MTVRAINLFEEDCPIQYDLFTDVNSLDRKERLDAEIEQIRFRFGKDAIKNGVLFQKSKMPTERKVDLVMPTGMIGPPIRRREIFGIFCRGPLGAFLRAVFIRPARFSARGVFAAEAVRR